MFVTVSELIGLSGLPGTSQGLRVALNKRAAGTPELVRRREGTKAFEYHVDCLPDEARKVVQARAARRVLTESRASVPAPVTSARNTELAVGGEKVQSELSVYRKCPAVLEQKLRSLTDTQKAVADARMLLACEIERLMDERGLNMKRKQAIEHIASESKAGTLPEHVQRTVPAAHLFGFDGGKNSR